MSSPSGHSHRKHDDIADQKKSDHGDQVLDSLLMCWGFPLRYRHACFPSLNPSRACNQTCLQEVCGDEVRKIDVAVSRLPSLGRGITEDTEDAAPGVKNYRSGLHTTIRSKDKDKTAARPAAEFLTRHSRRTESARRNPRGPLKRVSNSTRWEYARPWSAVCLLQMAKGLQRYISVQQEHHRAQGQTWHAEILVHLRHGFLLQPVLPLRPVRDFYKEANHASCLEAFRKYGDPFPLPLLFANLCA
eukprot:756620-Hanusia_phi.AAC.2